MKMYAETPARRTRQLVADLLVVGWVVLWIWAGQAVHAATQEVARPAERTQSAASGLADNLRGTGDSLGDIPLIGDSASAPLDDAAGNADDLAESSGNGVDAINALALQLGLAVALTPILVALGFYLPPRIDFVRDATAGQRFIDSGHDLDLFALRALAHQPLHRLAHISPDPAGAWRARDPRIVQQLAALEMRDVGLSPVHLTDPPPRVTGP